MGDVARMHGCCRWPTAKRSLCPLGGRLVNVGLQDVMARRQRKAEVVPRYERKIRYLMVDGIAHVPFDAVEEYRFKAS